MSHSSGTIHLPEVWTEPRTKARLHLLRSHESPVAVIIRRKPSKMAHVIAWNTVTDELEHGSWFRGRIYAERCDLSWDGRWMVYLAMGSQGETWNGICRPPWLRTVADVPNAGTWAGGGYFSENNKLRANDLWHSDRSLAEFTKSREFPFSVESMKSGGEVFPILSQRLERDGWQRRGEFGRPQEVSLRNTSYAMLCLDDPGWSWQPSPRHPVLRMFYRGYLVGGHTFEFRLKGSPLLGPEVDWATWDSKGDLLVARQGTIERHTLESLESGQPVFSLDLENLSPPSPAPREDAADSPQR